MCSLHRISDVVVGAQTHNTTSANEPASLTEHVTGGAFCVIPECETEAFGRKMRTVPQMKQRHQCKEPIFVMYRYHR